MSALACLWTAPAALQANGPEEPVRISKISFLIHPVCWDLALAPNGKPSPGYLAAAAKAQSRLPEEVEKDFMETLQWEREVNRKQRDYIRRMGADEALIVYPIGDRPVMRDLMAFGAERLGRRCIVIHSESPQDNKRVDYRKLLPEAVRLRVADDLLQAVQQNGTDPKFDMEVIFYNAIVAAEIQNEFAKRGLQFDPKTVRAVAFGEGFAACAMTWKAMVPHYLNLSNPIENDFELSVDGPIQLRRAVFKERVALEGDVRLFLWQLPDGRPMALYTRAAARYADQPLQVRLPFQPGAVRMISSSGKELPPSTDKAGAPSVGVYTSLRRSGDFPAYFAAGGIGFDEFRQALLKAPIAPEN